jgi:hypothetical protein
MVRSKIAARRGRAGVVGALVAVVLIAAAAVPHSQAPAASVAAIDALLQREGTTPPGTYVLNGSAAAAAATPLPVLLQADVLRGPGGTVRVPVVVGAELSDPAEIRLRIVIPAAGGQTTRVIANATGSGTVGPMRFVHEFTLAPGDYEIQAVVGQVKGTTVTAALAKSRLTVPDVWGSALAVTPIVLGEDTATARRSDIQPFNFGPTTLIPAIKAQFPQSGAIRVAFRVFNWTAKAEEKPDVTAEYQFYERGAKGLHFFNKVKPQRLPGPAASDASASVGRAVTGGMLVPLGSFTFGDFQLKINVTDNRTQKAVARVVDFSVSP